MVASLKLISGLASQLSLAVGAVKLGAAGLSMVSSAPWPLSSGAVVSATVMIWVALVALPQPSVAVQVRVRV